MQHNDEQDRHRHLPAKVLYVSSLVMMNLTFSILFTASFSWPVILISASVVLGMFEILNRGLEQAICRRTVDFIKDPLEKFQKDDLACINHGIKAAQTTNALLFSWGMPKTYTNYCAFAVGKHLAENHNDEAIKALQNKLAKVSP